MRRDIKAPRLACHKIQNRLRWAQPVQERLFGCKIHMGAFSLPCWRSCFQLPNDYCAACPQGTRPSIGMPRHRSSRRQRGR